MSGSLAYANLVKQAFLSKENTTELIDKSIDAIIYNLGSVLKNYRLINKQNIVIFVHNVLPRRQEEYAKRLIDLSTSSTGFNIRRVIEFHNDQFVYEFAKEYKDRPHFVKYETDSEMTDKTLLDGLSAGTTAYGDPDDILLQWQSNPARPITIRDDPQNNDDNPYYKRHVEERIVSRPKYGYSMNNYKSQYLNYSGESNANTRPIQFKQYARFNEDLDTTNYHLRAFENPFMATMNAEKSKPLLGNRNDARLDITPDNWTEHFPNHIHRRNIVAHQRHYDKDVSETLRGMEYDTAYTRGNRVHMAKLRGRIDKRQRYRDYYL